MDGSNGLRSSSDTVRASGWSVAPGGARLRSSKERNTPYQPMSLVWVSHSPSSSPIVRRLIASDHRLLELIRRRSLSLSRFTEPGDDIRAYGLTKMKGLNMVVDNKQLIGFVAEEAPHVCPQILQVHSFIRSTLRTVLDASSGSLASSSDSRRLLQPGSRRKADAECTHEFYRSPPRYRSSLLYLMSNIASTPTTCRRCNVASKQCSHLCEPWRHMSLRSSLRIRAP